MIEQNDIILLKFPENVRTRPSMYLGDLNDASIALREILDNSLDECYISDCDTIIINNNDGRATIIDNGRGIPIKKMPKDNITMALASITELHAGSKFNKTTAQVGQNGVGSSCIYATSSSYDLIVRCDDEKINLSTDFIKNLYDKMDKSRSIYYRIHGKFGITKKEELIYKEDICNYIPNINWNDIKKVNIGTLVSFIPDESIYSSIKMVIPDTLKYFQYIMKKKYHKDVTVLINNKPYEGSYKPYKYEIIRTIKSRNYIIDNIEVTFIFSFEFDENFDRHTDIGSVNSLVVNQGTHINYTRYAFKTAFNNVFPGDYYGNEIKGMNFSTILIAPEVNFSSQTKERLTLIKNIYEYDLGPLIDEIVKIIKHDRDAFEIHRNKVLEFNAAIKNVGKINYIKSKVPILADDGARRAAIMTPSKVKTCSVYDRSKAELFICEGRSAEGTMIQARDPKYHALLALRGKPLNSTAMTIEDILDNQEIKDIIATLGTGVDDYFSLKKINYGKIIITADADPDGLNITSLVLGLFLGHMRYLIKEGYVYICECPLFSQNNKFFYSDDFEKLDKTKPFKRFKGLGEMNKEEFYNAAFNPETRKLIRVTMKGSTEAVRLITSTYARKLLMMEKDVVNEDKLLTIDEVTEVLYD